MQINFTSWKKKNNIITSLLKSNYHQSALYNIKCIQKNIVKWKSFKFLHGTNHILSVKFDELALKVTHVRVSVFVLERNSVALTSQHHLQGLRVRHSPTRRTEFHLSTNQRREGSLKLQFSYCYTYSTLNWFKKCCLITRHSFRNINIHSQITTLSHS